MVACQIEGCDRPHRARGWCMLHYTRWRKTGTPGDAALQRVPHGTKTCVVPACGQDTSKGANGYCGMHYSRLRRGVELGPAGYQRDPNRQDADRIYPRLEQDARGCWIWTGALRNGYGVVGIGQDVVYVHRWVYEDMVAPIPEGLQIDHTCLNRACANPEHLDPVTDAVNKARGGVTHGERRTA